MKMSWKQPRGRRCSRSARRLATISAILLLASVAAFVGPAAGTIVGDGILGATPPSETPGSTACPAGTTVTGVAGNIYGTIVGSVTVLCSNGTAGTAMGAPVGSFGSTNCGVGETAVGIVGREDEFGVDQLALRCRASDLSGLTTTSAELGTTNGEADGPYDCPEGQALTGLAGTLFPFVADNLVREFGIQCGSPSGSLPPQVGLAPSGLSFGDQPIGSTSTAKHVTISNTAAPGTSLAITQLATGGAGAGDFALANDSCSNTFLSGGASCTVDVSFTPTTAGARSASLVVPSNAASSPDTVALNGNGTVPPPPPPTLGTSPSSVAFGDQLVGSASGPHTVMITNTAPSGSQSLMLSPLSIAGVNSADFNLGNDTCSGASLAAGNSCTVDIRFAPTAAGARSADLVIPNNAVSSPDTVALRGNGTAIPLADVRLAISGPGSAKRGAQITYVITVSNAGPSSAHNVVLTDPIDVGASLLGANSTKGSCTVSGKSGTVSCSFGDLAGGGSVGSTVSVKVTAKVGSTIANLASAYSTADAAGAATQDPDTSNTWAALNTSVTK
jgi:uncharacterized repeat protein (TIGR01451 family)